MPLLNCSLSGGLQTFSFNLSTASDATIVRASTQSTSPVTRPPCPRPGLYVLAPWSTTAPAARRPGALGRALGHRPACRSRSTTPPTNGSALAGTDYTTTSGTLTFPPGETAQDITVPIIDRTGRARPKLLGRSAPPPTPPSSTAPACHHRGQRRHPGHLAGHLGPARRGRGRGRRLRRPAGHPQRPRHQHGHGQLQHRHGGDQRQGGCGPAQRVYVGPAAPSPSTPGVTTQVVRVALLNCDQQPGVGFQTFNLTSAINARTPPSSGPPPRSTSSVTHGQLHPRGSTSWTRWSTTAPAASTSRWSWAGPRAPPRRAGHGGLHHPRTGRRLAGTDYTATSGTLTFPPGETAQNITVPIIDRTGSAPARGLQRDAQLPHQRHHRHRHRHRHHRRQRGHPGRPAGLSAPPDVVVGEADGYVDLPVTLNAPGDSMVTVNYATANGTGNGGDGYWRPG